MAENAEIAKVTENQEIAGISQINECKSESEQRVSSKPLSMNAQSGSGSSDDVQYFTYGEEPSQAKPKAASK